MIALSIVRRFTPGSWFAGMNSLPLACMDAGGRPECEPEGVRYTFADGSGILLTYSGEWFLAEGV